jgi:rubredoxin
MSTDQQPDTTSVKMECGICWYVYNPAEGDDVWPVQPGTEFVDLSPDWRCPVCDAPQTKFMRMDRDE